MSTVSVINVKHPSSASNNLVLDNAGNATFAGTAAMASSFLRNRIINGDMRIDQRNAGASVANSGNYNLDRWADYYSGSGRYSAQQSTVAPVGFTNSFLHTITTAVSPGASDVYQIIQQIEGYNVADLSFGTASASTVTVSFWVRSSIAGTYGMFMYNGDETRSITQTYSISSANTWEYKSVTFPGDTTGTWLTNNGKGLIVGFDQGSGSNANTATLGAWQSGMFRRNSSCVNLIATNGATFYLTGVQLEVGTAATPFERRQYGQELALCQRYYQRDVLVTVGGGATPTVTNRSFFNAVQWPVQMRSAPTMSLITTISSTNMNAGSWAELTASRGRFTATNSVANDCSLIAQYDAAAEL